MEAEQINYSYTGIGLCKFSTREIILILFRYSEKSKQWWKQIAHFRIDHWWFCGCVSITMKLKFKRFSRGKQTWKKLNWDEPHRKLILLILRRKCFAYGKCCMKNMRWNEKVYTFGHEDKTGRHEMILEASVKMVWWIRGSNNETWTKWILIRCSECETQIFEALKVMVVLGKMQWYKKKTRRKNTHLHQRPNFVYTDDIVENSLNSHWKLQLTAILFSKWKCKD